MRTMILAVTIMILSSGAALAETSLFAGAGARMSDSGTSAVGAVRASFGVAPLVSLAGELHGYFGGPKDAPQVDLAGGHLGLVADLPIPGPIDIELGGNLGYHAMSVLRHGIEDSALTLNLEVALGMGLGPADLRVSYNHAVWALSPDTAAQAMTGQLLVAIGFSL